jgi:hypothetical protein
VLNNAASSVVLTVFPPFTNIATAGTFSVILGIYFVLLLK